MSVEARPLFIPGLLLAGALITTLLPEGWRRTRLLVAVAASALPLVVVANLVALTSTGPVTGSLGEAVPGVSLSLRADQLGLALVVAVAVATLLALATTGPRSAHEGAILLTAAGAAVAALAGNAVVLFGGLELANLGGLLLNRAARGRVSRGSLAAFAIQHAFGLGLLTAAVLLIVATGTSDPYALPPSALGLAVAVPWGLAGASRLLAPGWWPGTAAGDNAAWLSVGAIPCGGAVLLRLVAGLDGAAEPELIGLLGAIGVAAALGGGVTAWRWQREPSRAGRALLVGAAGPVVALAAVPGGTGAFSAGLLALELAVLAAPAWSYGVGPARSARAIAALALSAAAGLPIGFGTTALVVELGALAALGGVYAALLLGLGVAALVVMAAGLGAAQHALSSPLANRSATRPLPAAALALIIGAVAALLPGAATHLALLPLAGSQAPTAVDLASLSGPGGAWPGGYLSLGLFAVLLAVASAAALLGRSLPNPFQGETGPRPRPAWLGLIRARRAAAPALRALGATLGAVDAWLVTQPGLIFAVVAAIAAIYIFR